MAVIGSARRLGGLRLRSREAYAKLSCALTITTRRHECFSAAESMATLARLAAAHAGRCTLLSLLPWSAFAQTSDAAAVSSPPLALGVTVSATRRADETAAYVFEAEKDQAYLIEVEQRSLDLVVTLERPGGGRESYDSPARRVGDELVLIEHAEPGTYHVTLSSDEHTGVAAVHAIRVSAVPVGNSEIGSLRLMSEAAAKNREGGKAAWAVATADYLAAAELWKKLGQTRREAEAKFCAAMLDYWRAKDYARSGELAAEAAKLYSQSGDEALFAKASYLEGTALIETAEEDKDPDSQRARALTLFTQAAAAQTRLGRVFDLAHTMNDIGLLYFTEGDWPNARRHWTEAATLFGNASEWTGELYAVVNLGVVDFEEGYVETAIAEMQHALELMPPSGDRRYRANTLANLGGMQRVFGRFDEAIRSFSDALALGEEIQDVYIVGWSLFGVGETYYSMGEFDLAAEYLRASLPKEREASDQRGEAAVLRYLGSIEYSGGRYGAALERHQKALELATSPPDRGLVEVLIAEDLTAMRRYADAEKSADAARATAANAGSMQLKADALERLGRVRLAEGNPREASQAFEQALEIYASQGLQVEQALALNGLALASRARGELTKAIQYGQRSLAQIEAVRGDIADPRLRAYYLGARREYYDLQIDLTMHAGAQADAAAAALEISERARARMLVDLLREAHVELAEPDVAIAARREHLYTALDELRRQRDQLRVHGAAGGGASLEGVLGKLAETEHDINVLESEARASNPERASLTAPQPLSAPQVRAALDGQSVLVEYALGEEHSYAWVVTRESVRAIALADGKTIEDTATRVYAALRSPRPSDDGLTRDLRRLTDLVITPLAPFLTKERLVIAADGALLYVPFAVLPVVGTDGTEQPLLRTHEIVGVPSVSALVSQRAGARRGTPSKVVAVFADPVFDRADPRIGLAPGAATLQPAGGGLRTRSSPLEGRTLTRLPFSSQEATAISNLVQDSERFIAVGFEANRAALLGMNLDDYRVIHFATHGLIDTRYPDLSALALSGFDPDGKPIQEFLGLRDIYALHLNADLVVLSACETALGKDIRGEGLLGFTQGFLYAGAKSVVASLWPVADRATAELMQRFYQHMLRDGLRPADALRRAQLALAAEPRWSAPFFWSPFVLLGDWQ